MKQTVPQISQGAGPYQHLDLELLAFRSKREYISVVLSLWSFVMAALGP